MADDAPSVRTGAPRRQGAGSTGTRRGQELRGVVAVVPSIFHDNGADLAAIERVASYLLQGPDGVAALTSLGYASESWALTTRQRAASVAAAVGVAPAGVPVIAGVDGELAMALEAGQMAARAGASHLMVRLPDLETADAAVGHLCKLHDETGLPMVLQDFPGMVARGMDPAELRVLVAEVPALVAVKLEGLDSGPSVTAMADLPVLTIVGMGGSNLPDRLRRGARGCMPGAGTAKVFVRILQRWEDEPVEAEVLYRNLLPLLAYAGQSPDLMIAATKRILVRLGVIESHRTVPGTAAPDELQLAIVDELIEELVGAGLLNSH